MKKLLTLFLSASLIGTSLPAEDNWSNWSRRLEEQFVEISSIKLPGKTTGIVVPADPRPDILQMSAFAYQSIAESSFRTIIFLLPAPEDYELNGLAMPGKEIFETPVGVFNLDYQIRNVLVNDSHHVKIDADLFRNELPPILVQQLAMLRMIRQRAAGTIQILPIYVKFSNTNDQAKDLAPFIVNQLKDLGADEDIMFCIVSNLARDSSDSGMVKSDASRLKAIRGLNPDSLIDLTKADIEINQNVDVLALGLLTLRWMGGDHAEILSYACTHQLLLTKDKKKHASLVSAAISNRPPIESKVPHVKQEKMIERFDELLRGDLLSLARQTLASTVDLAAAKPPSLNNKEAARKWPVYVSVLDPEGQLAGQAGSHVAVGPLEESIRKFAYEATQEAKETGLTKTNMANYLVEVTIPYGFENVRQADSYIPLLNGVIVTHKLKSSARHPETWRKYPDAHQILGVISTDLGLKPWIYATNKVQLESFRVFSFNEKEPFQDLGASTRKKKKKKSADAEGEDLGGGGDSGGGGGGALFGF